MRSERTMRTITSLVASSVVIATCITGCEQSGSTDALIPHENYWTSPAAATHNPAPSHDQQIVGSGQNGITDLVAKAAADATEGTPDQVARMHGTQKIQYAMLGAFLKDLGVTIPAAAT